MSFSMITETYQPRYIAPSIKAAMATVSGRVVGVHQACSRVPRIGARDFDQLVESIKTHGLLRPIEIDSNRRLIDGRSRLQACAVASLQLGEQDIVVTAADPWAIARSNNARRHLTQGQKAMEAERLLQQEKELAAQRKTEGGKKGRQSKQCSLGTDSVPSEAEPKKRQPRAMDKVAAATGVSREQLTLAANVRQADPETAEMVEQGEMTLEDAAKKTGVVPKKRIKPSVAKPMTQVPMNKPAKSKPTATQLPWKDEFTEITDTPDGLRTLRCPHSTFYIHKTEAFTGVVMAEKDKWWWCYAGTEGDQGEVSLREEAEQRLLACFSTNANGKR